MKVPATLNDGELAELLHKLPEVKRWANDVEEYCKEQAFENKRQFDGWKVVEGRANRKYVDDKKVYEKLTEQYDPQEVSETKVLSISKLEKQLGKKQVNDILGKLVTKPNGKPALVTEDDKREPISDSAENEFKDYL